MLHRIKTFFVSLFYNKKRMATEAKQEIKKENLKDVFNNEATPSILISATYKLSDNRKELFEKGIDTNNPNFTQLYKFRLKTIERVWQKTEVLSD